MKKPTLYGLLIENRHEAYQVNRVDVWSANPEKEQERIYVPDWTALLNRLLYIVQRDIDHTDIQSLTDGSNHNDTSITEIYQKRMERFKCSGLSFLYRQLDHRDYFIADIRIYARIYLDHILFCH